MNVDDDEEIVYERIQREQNFAAGRPGLEHLLRGGRRDEGGRGRGRGGRRGGGRGGRGNGRRGGEEGNGGDDDDGGGRYDRFEGRGGRRGRGQDRGRGGQDRGGRGQDRERGGFDRGREGQGRGRGGFDRGRGGFREGEFRNRHEEDEDGNLGGHDHGNRGRGRGGRGDRRGGGRGGGGGRGLSFQQLQELKTKDPSSIVVALGLDSGLTSLLRRRGIPSHIMYPLLEVISQACTCTTAPESLIRILLTIHQSHFYDQVTSTLTEVLSRPSENTREKRQFLKNIIHFMKELLIKLPHSFVSINVLGLNSFLEMVITNLEMKSDIIDDEILSMKAELKEMRETSMERMRSSNKAEDEDANEENPPDDFREISIYPNAADINPEGQVFLRKNIAHGGYRDLHHYLDVQFRLLREDFIFPLREGIDEYLSAGAQGGRGQRIKDIRVYHDVQVMRTVCSDSGLLHRISFDVSRLRKVRWENSKRLIYGSLVCLSHDNFQTLVFATVADRDPLKLRDGVIDVLFENTDVLDNLATLETRFVMVETTAYFEAYRHVLKGLQTLEEGDLPFEDYIVACECEVNAPRYLKTRTPKYDLRPLIDEEVVLREDNLLRNQRREVSYNFSRESAIAENVEILDHRDWPSAEKLHLDLSQYKAIKTALTKEFVITQGPPGTGKTYVGLKIVRALLHNSKLWNGDMLHRTPMLIVCYTNHALDQFLEGIISFFKGNVIRVGGRMTSEVLQDYSLKSQKQKIRRLKTQTRGMRDTGRLRWEIRQQMMDLKLKIERIGQQIEAAEREVLHEDTLQGYMGHHYNDLVMWIDMMLLQMQEEGYQNPVAPRSVITEWLGIGNTGDLMQAVHDHQVQEDIEEVDQVDQDEEAGDVDVEEEAEILQNQRRMQDLDDDDFDENEVAEMKQMLENLHHEKERYIAFDVSSLDRKPKKHQQNDMQFQLPREARKRLKRKLLKRLRSMHKLTEMQAARVRDPWNLQMDDRWKLYRFWVHQYCEKLLEDIREKEERYKRIVAQYKESQMIEDKQVLETATVIGMTTTGAARYQQVLTEIGPKIIVVEEAAEVLEGHIITTLSKKCQHLILIGDHKQLKPNPTVFKLAREFNLDLSLFERMINNGVQCDTLALQHRMRPEIATLMKHIYPKLENHSSVLNFENIKGISENIAFINHGYEEENDMERVSHSNVFEANYVVALCEYLMKQGYERSQITVLTTYSGQLFKLKKLMPKQLFQGVRITVVDNFQGEENDIIILSLVRSNSDGSVGFLKIENRVCVALSRAKKGLYVIGNFDLLAQQSQLWKEIVKDMKRDDRFGTSLHLYCQNHPRDNGIAAKTAEDFKKAPEGGCMKQCPFRLECGHVCSRPCHPYDPQHLEYQCTKQCAKIICKNNHSCPLLCYKKCEKCQVLVEKVLPRCQHKQMVPCSMDPLKFTCKDACEKILKCGHKCGNPCGMEHQCTQMVKKTWRCGHTADVQCSMKDTIVCKKKCTQQLKCEHRCGGNCHECHEGRLHVSCRQNCKRPLVCGHECMDRCSYCPPCRKQCENRCSHSRCFKSCGEICPPCNEPCEWRCKHHACTKKCSEPCNRPPCNEPCKKRLPCGHLCIGLCGEPCPRLCRICNNDDVTTIMFGDEDEPDARFVHMEDCGHIVEVKALDKYMQMDLKTDTVQLKGCPHCKTPIRRNIRYGSMIKTMLADIDKVKRRYIGKEDRIKELKAQLEREADRETDSTERRHKQDMLREGFFHTEDGLVAIQNQFQFLQRIAKVSKSFEKFRKDADPSILRDIRSSVKELEDFRKWMIKSRFSLSQQEEFDAQNELLRIKALLRLLTCENTIATGSIKLPTDVQQEFRSLQGTLKYGKPFTDERRQRAKHIFDKLKEHLPATGLGISDDERLQIVRAMGLQTGHWFKCPNGHIYAIADCGGATVESTCPECNARIGGTNHALRTDNALAPEMDGARYAAWSEQANMGNFDLDNLR